MYFLNKFKQDKLFYILLIIVFSLGTFIRLNDFSMVGYWNDDMATIPTALLVFYPYNIFPGLSGPGEPILGHTFIGLGCMLSGEDFSKVSEAKPMFYPGREILIGKELINAFPYCHISIYLFGILFFLIMSLLALFLLDKYSSIFVISFYAFHSELLQLSRWIHVDIFGYVFIALGLLFLWKFYISEKNKKEILFFILSFSSFALAFATKLSNGLFLFLATAILFDKYSKEFKQIIRLIGRKLELNVLERIQYQELELSRPIKIFIYSIMSYTLFILITLSFNPGNLFAVISRYQSVNPEYSTLSFNTQFFTSIIEFLLTVNLLDTLLFFISLTLFFKLIKFRKEKRIRFIFYLLLLLMAALILFKAFIYSRVFIAYSFGLIFLVSLLFSENYLPFNVSKIKRKLILVILLFYVIFSFTTAFSISPHFSFRNQIICRVSNSGCQSNELNGFAQKQVAEYLKAVLQKNETFLPRGAIIYYYIREEQHLQSFLFDQAFFEKFNRYPNLIEKIQYFHPNNQTIRYIIITPLQTGDDDEFIIGLRDNYKPNKIIDLKEAEASWIYDFENLIKR